MQTQVIQVKSSSGITLVPIDARLLAERSYFIEGEIGPETACGLTKAIMLLTKEDKDAPIDLLINSPGGEINSGLLMYDVIQSSKVPIRMFCLGKAYSMAALLFASGQHGRYMLPNSELMLHQPLLGHRVGGNASSIKSISDSLMDSRKKINHILAKHTGKTEAEIEAATDYDHYFASEEAMAFGLADEIVGFDRIIGGKNGI